jgi:hypothetical protein
MYPRSINPTRFSSPADHGAQGARAVTYHGKEKTMTILRFRATASLCAALLITAGAPALLAQGSDAPPPSGGASDLAQELTNPIADLVTLPLQVNLDRNIGPKDDGTKWTANVQPVIPFGLGEDWTLITRTIVPVIYQEDLFPGAGSQFGLGDVSLSLFFSPNDSGVQDLTWGVGPIGLLPTATDNLLGAEKWGAGPALVGVKMNGPWTLGMLANHVWSFAGDGDRAEINNTFAQPFAAYTTPEAWTLSLQSETTYNWEAEQWSVPVNAALAKLVKIGPLPVSQQGGVGYWVDAPDAGPEGFRFRFQANVVLPK